MEVRKIGERADREKRKGDVEKKLDGSVGTKVHFSSSHREMSLIHSFALKYIIDLEGILCLMLIGSFNVLIE